MATHEKEALLARREALRRFDPWVAARPMDLQPADALATVESGGTESIGVTVAQFGREWVFGRGSKV